MSAYHEPVLLTETIDGLRVQPGEYYIDATLGGGGHTLEILKRGGNVLGIDADKEAIEYASRALIGHGFDKNSGQWVFVHGNYRHIGDIAKRVSVTNVSGILFDLGVSSHQLDTPERGFSYRYGEAPLDLRLDQTEGETAAQYLSGVGEEELYEILAKYGEEERAGAIAHAIVRARQIKPIKSVNDVRDVLVSSLHLGEGDFAVLSRVFQALRIYINDELNALRDGLYGASSILAPKGRLVVISFHSLEDRIVKQFMRLDGWNIVTHKPIEATQEELLRNRRARSAKLRVAEKI